MPDKKEFNVIVPRSYIPKPTSAEMSAADILNLEKQLKFLGISSKI